MYQVYFIESITLDLCTYGSAVCFYFVSQSVSQVDQSNLQVLLARQVGFRAIHGILNSYLFIYFPKMCSLRLRLIA